MLLKWIVATVDEIRARPANTVVAYPQRSSSGLHAELRFSLEPGRNQLVLWMALVDDIHRTNHYRSIELGNIIRDWDAFRDPAIDYIFRFPIEPVSNPDQ